MEATYHSQSDNLRQQVITMVIMQLEQVIAMVIWDSVLLWW